MDNFTDVISYVFRIIKEHMMSSIRDKVDTHVLEIFCEAYCSVSVHPVFISEEEIDSEWRWLRAEDLLDAFYWIHGPLKKSIESSFACFIDI